MCGILGIFNSKEPAEKARKALEMMQNRGKDSYGSWSDGKLHYSDNLLDLKIEKGNILAQCLHSVVGFVKQPLMNKGVLVANCELYNWKELAAEHKIKAENDAELMLRLIEKIGFNPAIEKLRGDFAAAYLENNKLYLARDVMGVKPLWYSNDDGFAFASEKKALYFSKDQRELNPREIICYDLKSKKTEKIRRDFLSVKEIISEEKLKDKIIESIKIRLPEKKFGILFSGGLDSAFIAKVCKGLKADFVCYTAVFMENAIDLANAKKAAELLGVELKFKVYSQKEAEAIMQEVVPLIEDSNVPKVGVAMTIYAAAKIASADGIKVLFSGSGADEIFAGYHRHKNTTDIKRDIYSDLLKVYEKNTYRDDVVTMANKLEVRVPFLDKELAEYALSVSHANPGNKAMLRNIANQIGMPEEITSLPKKAAQYGSGSDQLIYFLANRKSKSAYLHKFLDKPIMKLGVLFSSGKDSCYSALIMKRQNYEISCLITMKSSNPDSYMFHTPNVNLAKLQAEAMNVPLIEMETLGEKNLELNDLRKAMEIAEEKYGIHGIVTGALYSNYQRERIENIADSLGLKIFSPLWHIDQETLMRNLLKEKFKFILSSVAAEGLDKSWLGREITSKDVDKLVELNKKVGLNIAFEGGEAESFVYDCPLFKKKIEIIDSKIECSSENSCRFVINDAKLADK